MRLIRPVILARVCALKACTLLLGLSVLPATAQAAPAPEAAQAKKPAATQSRTVRKTTYSASSSSARKARLARARAAVRARERARLNAVRVTREAMTPRFKTDSTGALVPDIRAAAAIIFNPVTGQVLWDENAQDKRSIASITKVMTAAGLPRGQPDLSQTVTVERSRHLRGLDDVPSRERTNHARQSAAPDAHRVRQRRRPGARAPLARRHCQRSSSA